MPTNLFADLRLSKDLLQVVRELGYETLTPIQAEAIPRLLAGEDVIGQARTGSGKTAAFSLPLLQRIDVAKKKIQGLVLCPTRELAAQVAREVRKLGRRHAGLNVLVVAGGMPSGPQRASLERGVHVVVGTPGRARDMLERGKLDLSTLRMLVLDEADRMLEMGFEEDLEALVSATPPKRQTVFFSATFPDEIEAMSARHQKSAVRITVADDLEDVTPIEQALYRMPRDAKPAALLQLLTARKPESALVFCNQKATVDELTALLEEGGFSAGALHGGHEQSTRDKIMAKFRGGSLRVLVATDVAARGLDIQGLDLVVNFDVALKPETHVHRIGRTGRAGRAGVALTLAAPGERIRIDAIEDLLRSALPRAELKEEPAAAASVPKAAATAAMETLYIAAGRKDKIRPGDILGALTGEAAGLDGSQIGKIEIHDKFTYVAVAKDVAQAALHGLRNGKIKGKKYQVEIVR